MATPATSAPSVCELGDGERRGMAVDEGDSGRLAVGKLDGEMQAEVRAGHAQLVLAHLVEEARAVAEDDGNAGDGIPDDVAEAAQAGEVDADAVPVGVEGHVVGRADGDEALGGLGDGAGVGDVELESCAGSERLASGTAASWSWPVWSTSELSVATVKGDVVAGDANALPVERRRDLQRDVGERRFAVVAHGDEGADGDVLLGGVRDARP